MGLPHSFTRAMGPSSVLAPAHRGLPRASSCAYRDPDPPGCKGSTDGSGKLHYKQPPAQPRACSRHLGPSLAQSPGLGRTGQGGAAPRASPHRQPEHTPHTWGTRENPHPVLSHGAAQAAQRGGLEPPVPHPAAGSGRGWGSSTAPAWPPREVHVAPKPVQGQRPSSGRALKTAAVSWKRCSPRAEPFRG